MRCVKYRNALEKIHDLASFHGEVHGSAVQAYNHLADQLNAIKLEVRYVLYGEEPANVKGKET